MTLLFLLIFFVLVVIFFISAKKEPDSLIEIQQPKVDLIDDSVNKDSYIKKDKITNSENNDLEEIEILKTNEAKSNQNDLEYIFDCTNQLNKVIEEYKNKYESESLVEAFKNTNTENAQLAYFLMNKDKKDIGEKFKYLLDDMEKNYQNNKLKAFAYSEFCNSNPKHCNKEIIKKIYRYYDNGILWLEILNKNGTKENKLDVLDKISNAREVSFYYSDFISLYMQAYKDININSIPIMISSAYSNAASFNIPNFKKLSILIKFCEKESEFNSDIMQSCLDAGDNIVSKAKTSLTKVLGITLQIKTLSKLNMKKVLEAKELEKKNMYVKFNDKSSIIMYFDEKLFNFWLQHLKVDGEKAAYEALHQEAIYLSKDPNYNPCPDDVLIIN